MEKMTLKEAFQSLEDIQDESWDYLTQVQGTLKNKQLNESLKEMYEPISSFKDFTFIDKTNQGWEVKKVYRDLDDDRMHIIVYRPKRNDYAVGLGYSPEDGTWNQGRYDFKTLEDAIDSLKRDYNVEDYVAKKESCKESEELNEKLPPDLAKAYRNAPVESDKIGFTGVGAKYKDYGKYVELKRKSDDSIRRNVKTDYANSEYKEITSEEALQAKKDGNIGKLRILIDGNLVQYRNDGYPLVGPELGYRDERAYKKKNGEEVRDTKRIPFNYLITIADKIYLTDEDEHSIGKGGQQFNYETRNWEEVPGDDVYNRRQANQDIEDTGRHQEKQKSWWRDDTERYKEYVRKYQKQLDRLEQDYADGDISKNEYEKKKASLQSDIEYYTKYVKDYSARANKEEQDIRNRKARRRYQASADKLTEPLKQLRHLKNNDLYYAKRELDRLEQQGLSSWSLKGGSYKEKQDEIAKLKAQIEAATKRIEQLEKESQGLDDANAKQNAQAIQDAQNKVNDIQSQIDKLLRRDKKESLGESETTEVKKIKTSRGEFEVVNKTEDELRKDGYGYYHSGNGYKIFTKNNQAVAIKESKLNESKYTQITKNIEDGTYNVKVTDCCMTVDDIENYFGYDDVKDFMSEEDYYACMDKWEEDMQELAKSLNVQVKTKKPSPTGVPATITGRAVDIIEFMKRYTNHFPEQNDNGTWWYDGTEGEALWEDRKEFERFLNEVDESCSKKSNKKQLKEAEKIDINSEEEVEKGKEIIKDNQEPSKEDNVEQIVDVDAETIDQLKDSYIGNAILQCPVCRTMLYKKPDALQKDEENIADNPADQLWNVGEQCPHCGSEDGFYLAGQVAAMDVDAEQDIEQTTGKEDVNDDNTVEDEPIEEPIEDTFEDEEEVTFESLNIDRFNKLANNYLTNLYENVESFTTTNAEVNDEDNRLMIEGIIKYKSGKTKNTRFIFEAKQITDNNKYLFEGYNETFSSKRDAFKLKANIKDNTLFTESLKYTYAVKTLNESKLIKGKVNCK